MGMVTRLDRREFLRRTMTAGTAAAVAGGIGALPLSLRNRAQAAGGRRLKITGIEWDQILVPYQAFNSQALFRYHGLDLQLRTIFRVTTNSDLVGIGESWGGAEMSDEDRDKYIGTSPFDWIGDRKHLFLNMALYDLMGKSLGVPAWRLIGPQVRDRIPVAAWTVSRSGEDLAEEIRQAARRGYRWLKYHIDEVHNVIDQTRAMQKAAPRGFRVQLDFNANAAYKDISPIIKELGRFPVIGRIEDPIATADRDGYRKLIAETNIELLIHHGPVDYLVDRACDGYMAGHAPIGHAIKVAGVSEVSGLPFMLQQAGGQVNQAFLAHEVAVFRGATIDHVNLAHLWTDDVTTSTARVINGSVAVPKGPGLGLTLDEAKLEKYRTAPRPGYEPFLVEITYPDMVIIVRHQPDLPGCTDNLRFLGRLLKGKVPNNRIPGPRPGYANKVTSRFLDKKNRGDFAKLWKATERGALVLDRLGRPT